MKLDQFLDILHDTASLKTITIISPENANVQQGDEETNAEKVAEFKEMMTKNAVQYHKVYGKYGGIEESSFLIENIEFDTAKNMAQYFDQESFIFGHPYPEARIEPYVYEKGKTKYQFGLYLAEDEGRALLGETKYIEVNEYLSDDYSYFEGEPNKKFTFRFFEDFDPKKSNYYHDYEPKDEVIDGVKESTIKRIREVIGRRR